MPICIRPGLACEPFSKGDRVTEHGAGDIVLTVTSCHGGYVHAERWEKHPDRKFETGFVLPGGKVRVYACQAKAEHFDLFARAGDERPDPVPRPAGKISHVRLLELSQDGRISRAQYDAAYTADAAEALMSALATAAE